MKIQNVVVLLYDGISVNLSNPAAVD